MYRERVGLLMERAFMLLAVMAAVAAGMTLPEGHERDSSVGGSSTKSGVCLTKDCVHAASRILSALDTTTDPCQDFYQFACGKWIEDNPIPETEGSWSSFSMLDEKVRKSAKKIAESSPTQFDPLSMTEMKTMYASCMDETTIELSGYKNLIELLINNEFGGWPMVQKKWDSSKFDLAKAAASVKRHFGTEPLINSFVFLDSFDSSINRLHLDQPSLILPRDMYLEPDQYDKYLTLYKNTMKQMAFVMTEQSGDQVDEDQITEAISQVVQFEKHLATIIVAEEDRRNTSEMYHLLTVQQLGQQFPMDWSAYFTSLFDSMHIELKDSDSVVMVEPEYFTPLIKLLESTPISVQADYLWWRVIMSLSEFGPSTLRNLRFSFVSELYGISQKPTRTTECVEQVQSDSSGFGFAVAHGYIKKYFDEAAKKEVDDMVTNLRTAFKSLVAESEWMDAETQVKAKEKADLMIQMLGFPEWVADHDQLDAYFKDAEPMSEHEFLTNVLSMKQFYIRKELRTIQEAPDRHFWFRNPATVNAWYSPNHNSITFPAGILQPPFFQPKVPKYLNYGGIGVVIGHEITHGFDDQGRQMDGKGVAEPWWSEDTVEAFTSHAQCFIDMYDNFTVPELVPQLAADAHLNGKNTQGENIADNGGLRESFRAYTEFVKEHGEEDRLPGLNDYTSEQMFFISNAQVWCSSYTLKALLNQVLTNVHSPAKYRVNGPLSNSPDFIHHFQCPVGSAMHRPQKCLLW